MKTLFLSLGLASLIPLQPLHSALQDHFKKAEGKSDIHRMEGIDFIYVLNLDQRPEKYAATLRELEPYGIYPYRFSAVNGWELTHADLDDVGVKFQNSMRKGIWGTSYLLETEWEPQHEVINQEGRVYFCHCMSRGAVGICLSHLSILQDAYDSGYETIWVMEDDIQVIRDPHLLSSLIHDLDKNVGKGNWDVLFTDRDTKSNQGHYVSCSSYASRPNFKSKHPEIAKTNHKVGKKFRKIGCRYGAYSMIVRRCGMKKILDFMKSYNIFLPYDMDFVFPKGINLYAVREDVVSTTLHAASDNGGAFYLNNP